MMDYNLEGKTFRSIANSSNGEVGADTIFHYHQSGRIVTATYAGGSIVRGHLMATLLDNGQLDMRYHHVNTDGELKTGKCVSTPRRLGDGRLRFHEEWQWLSGDMSSGTSEIEEVVSGMATRVETSTPPGTPAPIGPYSHISKVGQFITIGGTAGFVPQTGALAGPDVDSQTRQILASFQTMLESVDSDLAHVVHINVFLKDMRDFDAMNRAYVQTMGDHRPARTVVGVRELPKPGVLLTMNLTAVTRD